jgi:hypothetical protein
MKVYYIDEPDMGDTSCRTPLLGPDYADGFYFSKPRAEEELAKSIERSGDVVFSVFECEYVPGMVMRDDLPIIEPRMDTD